MGARGKKDQERVLVYLKMEEITAGVDDNEKHLEKGCG